MSYTRSMLRGAKNKADQKVPKNQRQAASKKISAKSTTRILNGFPATIEEFPFTAYVSNCTGAILGNVGKYGWVLTAGHCSFVENVVAGFADKPWNMLWTDAHYQIIKQYTHPDWNGSLPLADIRLLQLNRPIAYGTKVAPILISNNDNHKDGEWLTGVGWAKGPPINSRGNFEYLNGKSYIDYEERAIRVEWGKVGGTRPGDSGGPLVKLLHNNIGPISYLHMGISSGYIDSVSWYSRTSFFADWIYKTTGFGQLYTTQDTNSYVLWCTNPYPQIAGFSSIHAGVMDLKVSPRAYYFSPQAVGINQITSHSPVKICTIVKQLMAYNQISVVAQTINKILAGNNYTIFIDFNFDSNNSQPKYVVRFQAHSSEIQSEA